MTSLASHDALVMVVPMEQWAGQLFHDKSADLWVVILSDHNEKYSDRMERSYKAFAVTFELIKVYLSFKTTIIHQLERLCIPDCAYMENMFINSIHISLYDISLTQNIQRYQRTWWQIVATPYYGISVIVSFSVFSNIYGEHESTLTT